jgi:hypothetical protein
MPTHSTTSSGTSHPARPATLRGFILLLAALLICGAVLGFLSAILARLFTLPLLYALLTGFGLGFVAAHAIRVARVGNVRVLVITAFIGALTAFITAHAFDYHHFRRNLGPIPAELRTVTEFPSDQRASQTPPTPRDRDNLELMYKAARVGSLWHFLDLQARRGVEFRKTRSGPSGVNLGYAGSWAYWSAEILLMAGLAFAIARRTPYPPDHAHPDR